MFSINKWQNGQRWTNWSESYAAYPTQFYAPHTIEEICEIVQRHVQNKHTIRVTGAAHSFSPVALPEQSALSLHNMRGLLAVDKENQTATFLAGTYLYEVGPMLAEYGLALSNMGDIQQQTLAGAISTGTHGTGILLGSFSSMVTNWGFVNGKGEYIEHERSNEDPLSESLHVSLGLLGILVKVTIKVIPLYSLAYTSERADFQNEMTHFQHTIREHRNVEWFYFPGSKHIQVKKMQAVAPVDQPKFEKYVDQLKVQSIENGLFFVASEICKYVPATSLAVSRLASKVVGNEARTGKSYEIYPSPRSVKFVETEYAIPVSQVAACMEEVHAMFQAKKFDVHFPIELRITAGEQGYLSPTQGQESAFIAFHMYKGMNEGPYFDWVHALMKKYNGRPHWGKMNHYQRENIEAHYPNATLFNAQRKIHDPNNVFLTHYFRNIFSEM